MKKIVFTIATIAVAMLMLADLLFFRYFFGDTPSQVETQSALQEKADLCAGIAENAVANFQVMLEFQKLEKACRKANVMKRCMRDHGFEENTVWLKYALPIAKKKAEGFSISEDEALENMRREAMYSFLHANHAPSYWHAKSQQ